MKTAISIPNSAIKSYWLYYIFPEPLWLFAYGILLISNETAQKNFFQIKNQENFPKKTYISKVTKHKIKDRTLAYFQCSMFTEATRLSWIGRRDGYHKLTRNIIPRLSTNSIPQIWMKWISRSRIKELMR